ncbi:MAG: SAM-dependent methyltransferase [Ruminococcus sp.]|nr:SAM-dependent methyltransferase [Ruminococcus sp.]
MNDRRLLACAQLCKGSRVCDVGTDHGYLAIELVSSGKCQSAAACDINEQPLASARENIEKSGLSDRIETFLSDGLDAVPDAGITDVVIAGMGGELITDILSRAGWIKERRVNLVLQPMTKWDHLRGWLMKEGFEVTKELACAEGRFVYSVIQAVYTGRVHDTKPGLDYLYGGLVSPDTEDGRAYLSRQASRLRTAGEGIARDPARSFEAGQYLEAADILEDRIKEHSP